MRWIASSLATALLMLVPTLHLAAAGAPPITVPFDHLSTGFELDGVHRDLPCESCHLNAIFKGTPRNCGICHITGSTFNATPKTATHIMSTNNCAACHDTTSFRPDIHFDHGEVMGSCVSCHNGVIATGMTIPPHPNTSLECAACHTVLSWNPPKAVDHTQIPLSVQGFCIICHNGSPFTGKPKGHVATTLECGDCHVTTTWLGSVFNHTGIRTGCVSCHNGVKAVGKQGNHMPTTNLCENCHTTGIGTAAPSWVPSAFDHTQMTVTTCQTCHSGSVKISTGFVSGQPANHVPPIPSSIDCGVCHGNTPAAETWTVLAASIAVLHTGLNVANCTLCHGGETFAGVPAPYIPMSITGVSPTKKTPLAPPHIPILAGTDCSACHGAAYTAGGFGPATAMSAAKHKFVSATCDTCHDTGKSFYVGSGTALQLRPADHLTSGNPQELSGDCSACHNTTDWTSTTMPVGHMPNPSNLSCLTCHTKSPSDYTPATLAANSVLHTGVTGNCGLCHGNNVAALTWANGFTPKDALLAPLHIPYLAGTDCSSCHSSSTYAVGTFGPMNMTQAKHAFTPPACNTCHEAGLSFYMGAASPALQGRPADHTVGQMVAPNDCSLCHTTANWNSNMLPAGHMPNPGNAACTVCHTTAPADYTVATLAATSVLHTGVNGGCATCHGGFSALTWANNFTPKDGILGPPAHIPYTAGSDCSSCHAANYVTGGFGPTNMSAAKHAFVPAVCATCHEAGLSFFLGTSTPALQGRPADHLASGDAQQKTGDCSLCHNTTDWASNTLPIGHMPNPGAQACAVCHTAINGTFASYATLGSISALHTGISGNCGQCHGSPSGALTFYNNNDNPKAAVLTPVHIPYLSGTDCSSCHATNYIAGGFGPTGMTAAKHAFVPAACNTCHEAGLTFYMGASAPALQGRPVDHTGSLAAPADCSGCHTTANWVTTALPAGHMPNPGGQTCAICHTGDLSTQAGYATLASIATLHTGITGGCGQCHGSPSGALTFYNNNDPIKAAVLSPVHIPYLTGADCSSCHASTYAAGGFGPTNMSAAKHAFVPTTCDTCHEAGLTFYLGASTPALQGRPTDHTTPPNSISFPQRVTGDCSGCHNTTTWLNAGVLPPGHMPNPGNQACTVCHLGAPSNYKTPFASIQVLHTGISTGCNQCHGGATQLSFTANDLTIKAAASLSPAHIPSFTNNDCSACHTANYVTGGFGPMNMTQATHTNVSTVACKTCHEAGLNFYMGAASPALQGRPADHTGSMAAPADCSVCHTTINWNSNTLPSGHMPTPGTQTCNTCHTAAPTNYKVFATNAVLHTGITGNCSQCHGAGTQLSFYNNDMVVKDSVLAPSHIPYISGTDCSSCHKSTTYAAGTFGPMNMTQATHAFVSTTCNTCHGTATVSFYIGAASPTLQLRPADHTSGNQVAPNDCSGCHTTANWNSNSLPTGHMPNPANQACTVCHTTAPADYTTTTLAANSVLHTGISSNCSQCHGATTALTWYNNYTPKDAILAPAHIPYVAGTDCSSCHKSTTYAVGGFGPMNMTQATHGFVSTTCDTCHGTATASFYIGAASPTLQLRPADHTTGTMLTGDCSGCHTTANWNSTALPAGHMPNPGNQACLTCHTSSPANYKVFAANSVLHTGITGNCSQCHGAGTQLSFYNNDMVIKDSVLSPAHIPYLSGTDCGSCHKSSTYAAGTFGPMNMSQATHAFVSTTCDTCHASAAGSLYMGAASPALQLRPADHNSGTMATGDCGGCHTTANWNSGSLPAGHMPTPGTATCAVCHTAAPANYTTMATNAILHTGITSGCITCHGQTQLSFYNNNDPPKPMVAGHIPSAATPCEDCHSKTTFTTFSGTTMSSAKHTLMFAVIGKTCDACHETGRSFTGVTNLTTRPNNHHVGQDCSGCHGTNDWGGGTAKRTVAAATTASRSTIGTVVSGTATAQSTSLAGAALIAARSGSTTPGIGPLGTTVSTGGTMLQSHAGVTGNCVSCHNGVLAQGKGATHIASNNACSNCHTTMAWLPAHFDHQGVTASCVSCHNGVSASGKPIRHVQTTQDCGACHGTITWAAATFNHLGINATCQSCHNGVTATGKQAQHPSTTQDCGVCHNTLNWTTTKPSVPLRPLLTRPRAATAGPAK